MVEVLDNLPSVGQRGVNVLITWEIRQQPFLARRRIDRRNIRRRRIWFSLTWLSLDRMLREKLGNYVPIVYRRQVEGLLLLVRVISRVARLVEGKVKNVADRLVKNLLVSS